MNIPALLWTLTANSHSSLRKHGNQLQHRKVHKSGMARNHINSAWQQADYISPHSVTTHCSFGLLAPATGTFSILRTTSKPSPSTLPNTTCLPSSQSVLAQVMKNWHPFVLGPLFACKPESAGHVTPVCRACLWECRMQSTPTAHAVHTAEPVIHFQCLPEENVSAMREAGKCYMRRQTYRCQSRCEFEKGLPVSDLNNQTLRMSSKTMLKCRLADLWWGRSIILPRDALLLPKWRLSYAYNTNPMAKACQASFANFGQMQLFQ